LAEWLRDLALKAARQRPADPAHAPESLPCDRQANAEGKHLLAESVLRIRDQANARKLADARKMIESFHAQEDREGQTGGQP
jgi:hypothetical protein